MSVAVTSDYRYLMLQVAYQQYEGVTPSSAPSDYLFRFLQVAYQKYTVISDVLQPTIEVNILKIINNVISFAFSGKAYTFRPDVGFEEFGSPGAFIFPVVTSDGERIVVTGGLTEEGLIIGDVLGFNFTYHFVVNALPKSLVCWAYGSPDIELVLADDKGNVVKKMVVGEAVLLQPWWKLVSSKEFSVLCTPV